MPRVSRHRGQGDLYRDLVLPDPDSPQAGSLGLPSAHTSESSKRDLTSTELLNSAIESAINTHTDNSLHIELISKLRTTACTGDILTGKKGRTHFVFDMIDLLEGRRPNSLVKLKAENELIYLALLERVDVDPAFEIRLQCVAGLERFYPDERVREKLLSLTLRKEDSSVAVSAIQVISHWSDRGGSLTEEIRKVAEPRLLELLDRIREIQHLEGLIDSERSVGQMIISTLASWRSQALLERMPELLSEPSPHFWRASATRGLGHYLGAGARAKFSDLGIVAILKEMESGEDGLLRMEARDIVKRIKA